MLETLESASTQSPLMTFVLAAGALGTAAFGIVEGLKWFALIGEAGFRHIERFLEEGFGEALVVAYGKDAVALLRAQYRSPKSHDELVRTLRQGVRLGLTASTASKLAQTVGVVAPEALTRIASSLASSEASTAASAEPTDPLTDAQRALLGRFELAVDTRIDAVLTLSEDTYRSAARFCAALIAIAIALATAVSLGASEPAVFGRALLLGLMAVPIAPIAKDVTSGIAAAAKAIGARK